MKINKENYEIYFLDYFEKRLAPEQVAELMVFLEQNPELKAEFDTFELIELETEKATQVSFSNLKKQEYKTTGSVDAWNYEEKMVAFLEGDLDEKGKSDVQHFITINPKARLELNFFRKTILQPENISYPNKSELKKGGVLLLFRRPLFYTVSTAAAIIILFGLFSLLRQGAEVENPAPITNVELPAKVQEQIPVNESPVAAPKEREQFVAVNIGIEESTREMDDHELFEPMQSLRSLHVNNIQISSNANHHQAQPIYANAAIDVTQFEVLEAEENRPSFAARFISGLASKVIGNPNPDKKTILELSVEGYNLMADREVEVEKETDEAGNVIAYNVRGDNVAFTRKVKKQGVE